jgi:hypothetical protein
VIKETQTFYLLWEKENKMTKDEKKSNCEKGKLILPLFDAIQTKCQVSNIVWFAFHFPKVSKKVVLCKSGIIFFLLQELPTPFGVKQGIFQKPKL